MMAHMKIDPARSDLLTGFFETYLTLTSSEEKKLQEEVKRMDGREGEKVREFIVSYEKKGMEKGKEKTKTEIAEAMLKKDLDVETIAEVTGLSTDEVLQLKQ